MAFIYDLKWNEVEIFDPMGAYILLSIKSKDINFSHQYAEATSSQYEMSHFNSAIRNYFYDQLKVQAVFLPYEWCPLLGIQYFEKEEKKKAITETPGYCMAWSIWWINKRATNPNADRFTLLRTEMQKLKNNGHLLTSYIRAYAKKIGSITQLIMIRSLMAGGIKRREATIMLDTYWNALLPILNIMHQLSKSDITLKQQEGLKIKLDQLENSNRNILTSISGKVYSNLELALQEIPNTKYVITKNN
jgi:hypothetical protein